MGSQNGASPKMAKSLTKEIASQSVRLTAQRFIKKNHFWDEVELVRQS